jgi:hypothetical protein
VIAELVFTLVISTENSRRRDSINLYSASGFLYLIPPHSRFRLMSGEDAHSEYSFNTGVAKHVFCKLRDIKSFYFQRSNPEGVDVNASCLDGRTVTQMTVEAFDGQNWEDNATELAHFSLS